MTKQLAEQKKETSGAIHLLVKRLWLLAVASLALLGLAVCLLFVRRGTDFGTSLQAIDAAHAVPDEENAARMYVRLMGDANLPPLASSGLPVGTLGRPWRSAEFPSVAAWVRERQAVLAVLLEAGRRPRCWFSVSEARGPSDRRGEAAVEWHELLLRAANNDLGDGRVEDGLEKLFCMLRLTQHLSCQSDYSDHFMGVVLASVGLHRFYRLVVREDVTSEWLDKFEAVLPSVEGTPPQQARELQEVERLHLQQIRRGVLARFVGIFASGNLPVPKDDQAAKRQAESRAARILIALRRCRDRTGTWPADLKEIQSMIPSVVLRDPLSGKSFGYRPEGDRFQLYSVGADGADNGGRSGDDVSFWPP
jgi:hypothetical protein